MRESTLQLINYGMIIGLLVALFAHLVIHGLFGLMNYEGSLYYPDVVAMYKSILFGPLLAVLLVTAAYHGLYGTRNFLLEIRSGPMWDKAVSYGTFLAGAALVVWGMRTIILTAMGA